jgi:hypothetical protein
MRATIDIPDETFRRLKIKAAEEGVAYRQLVLRGVDYVLNPAPAPRTRRLKLPIIPSRKPGSINPTEEQLIDAFFGPID